MIFAGNYAVGFSYNGKYYEEKIIPMYSEQDPDLEDCWNYVFYDENENTRFTLIGEYDENDNLLTTGALFIKVVDFWTGAETQIDEIDILSIEKNTEKYKTFRLSEKQVWAIKTMIANTDPSEGGADDEDCRHSLMQTFGDFGQYWGENSDPLLDFLNVEFIKLLEKHEDDVKYDHPKEYGWEPEDEECFAPYENAFSELMSKDPNYPELFDYEFGKGNNKWDVGIVRK